MRLIYVVGTPSGGTSCVAGILHHLGVNMGRFPVSDGIRGYATYEDTDTNAFKVTLPGESEIVIRQRLRFRDYIAYRVAQSGNGGRIGMKGSALWWLNEPDPMALAVDVIRVRRPVEDAILSDWKIQHKIYRNRPDLKYPPMLEDQHLRRAGAVAACWAGCELLSYLRPPVADLEFYDVLARPAATVATLCEALEISPGPSQLRDAIQFVDPGKRHV